MVLGIAWCQGSLALLLVLSLVHCLMLTSCHYPSNIRIASYLRTGDGEESYMVRFLGTNPGGPDGWVNESRGSDSEELLGSPDTPPVIARGLTLRTAVTKGAGM